MSAMTCTCDAIGDGPCPTHAEAMREQDARIAKENAAQADLLSVGIERALWLYGDGHTLETIMAHPSYDLTKSDGQGMFVVVQIALGWKDEGVKALRANGASRDEAWQRMEEIDRRLERLLPWAGF